MTNLFLTLPASHIYIYFQIACLNLDIFSEGRRGGGGGTGEGGGDIKQTQSTSVDYSDLLP